MPGPGPTTARAAAGTAAVLCPEVNAAVEWSLGRAADRALELATVLAIGGEQYGPDLASLRSIARVAEDHQVRAVARPQQLFDLGLALSYLDLDLMGDLARLSGERADGTERDRLLVEHLSGCAAAYRHDAVTALGHLDAAERLADQQLDVWRLGHVRQMRGLAHARPGRPRPRRCPTSSRRCTPSGSRVTPCTSTTRAT